MEAFKQLESLVTAKIDVVKSICSIIKLEAKLAGLSIFPLLLNICMLLVVLISVWLTTTLLLGYLIFLTSNHLLLSIGFVLLLNIGLLFALLKYLSFNLKSMSFQKTREFFSQNKSDENDEL
ncbi:MAG: hypothetical protein HYX60_02980 [Legionella longbeachae]|nr:hypothetical protein [Legionella longbeachae]